VICRRTKTLASTMTKIGGECYLSGDDHDRKIRARKQRTDIDKHSFVKTTVKLWNQLPAEALATFLCKSHIFRKRVREVIISEGKWRVFEAWWRNVQKWREVKNGEWSVVNCSEVKWCDVKWSDVKWSEVMWCDVKWSEVKWCDVMILGQMYYNRFIVM
jgi:hypothetical protein